MRVIENYLPKLKSNFEISRYFSNPFGNDLAIYGYVPSIWIGPHRWADPKYKYFENDLLLTTYFVARKV